MTVQEVTFDIDAYARALERWDVDALRDGRIARQTETTINETR